MSRVVVPGLVSVIVASYNHAGYLVRRMESLVAQTYPDIEILVIDDCSPDNSWEVLQAYASTPRVSLVRRERNGGWVAVSNQGVAMARGEFVLFANCDDACDESMIERLVEVIKSRPAVGLAFCRSRMVDETDGALGDDFEVREQAFKDRCHTDTLIGRNEMRRFLLHSCVIPNLSAALMRRDAFEAAGALSSNYRACSDWELFFRLADSCDFAYIAEPLNHFRQHGTTIRSATKGRVTYDEFFRLLLGEIPRGGLTQFECLRYRTHVMYLWVMELMRPSLAGWANFPHHFSLVLRLDALALSLLPLAMLIRIAELPGKLAGRLIRFR